MITTLPDGWGIGGRLDGGRAQLILVGPGNQGAVFEVPYDSVMAEVLENFIDACLPQNNLYATLPAHVDD